MAQLTAQVVSYDDEFKRQVARLVRACGVPVGIVEGSIEYRRTCPNSIVVLLHPGTTDTDLSQPFQANVPEGKLFGVDRTVSQLLTVIKQLESPDSGEFFNWDGTKLPW